MSYNCKNDYELLGFDTPEECCEEEAYKDNPEMCPRSGQSQQSQEVIRKNLKCTDRKAYTKFKLERCMPVGWIQNNDDCWIDSGLYALFASNASSIFSDLLGRMRKSRSTNMKEIAYNISNYLRNIDLEGDVLESMNKCKQEYKNLIVYYFNNYIQEKGIDYDIFQQIRLDTVKDVGRGNQDIILRIFYEFCNLEVQTLGKSDFNIIFKQVDSFAADCEKNISGINKLLLRRLWEILQDTKKSDIVIFIDINGINPISCTDRSKIKEIQQIGNYKLVSYISGKGAHITTNVWCKDSMNWYDNMNEISRVGNIPNYGDTKTLTMHEQITFIYVRN
jgi:hypothetical protein